MNEDVCVKTFCVRLSGKLHGAAGVAAMDRTQKVFHIAHTSCTRSPLPCDRSLA